MGTFELSMKILKKLFNNIKKNKIFNYYLYCAITDISAVAPSLNANDIVYVEPA